MSLKRCPDCSGVDEQILNNAQKYERVDNGRR